VTNWRKFKMSTQVRHRTECLQLSLLSIRSPLIPWRHFTSGWEGATSKTITGKEEPTKTSVKSVHFKSSVAFARNGINIRKITTSGTETTFSLLLLAFASTGQFVPGRSADYIRMSGNTPKSMSNRLMTMKVRFRTFASQSNCSQRNSSCSAQQRRT